MQTISKNAISNTPFDINQYTGYVGMRIKIA